MAMRLPAQCLRSNNRPHSQPSVRSLATITTSIARRRLLTTSSSLSSPLKNSSLASSPPSRRLAYTRDLPRRPATASLTSSQSRLFSSSPAIMAAERIDGNAIAKEIRAKLHEEINERQKTNSRFVPALTIVQGMRAWWGGGVVG